MSNIPKKLHHIWIGPHEPPLEWMQTWRNKHPDWEYTLWGNIDLFRREWRTKRHMESMYMSKRWAGVADLMRYEILYEHGGFVAPADSICLRNVSDLLDTDYYDAFSCYEHEEKRPGLVMPLLAASEGNLLARYLIESLENHESVDGEPWQVTGNQFMRDALAAYPYERINIWPSIVMIPEHYTGAKGIGDLPNYATHEWGSKGDVYPHHQSKS